LLVSFLLLSLLLFTRVSKVGADAAALAGVPVSVSGKEREVGKVCVSVRRERERGGGWSV